MKTAKIMKKFNILVEAGEYKQAHKVAMKMYKAGYAEGAYALSQLYHNGAYVEKSFQKEFQLLVEASDLGNLDATYDLAISHALAWGTKQDLNASIGLLRDIEAGYEPARELLASLKAGLKNNDKSDTSLSQFIREFDSKVFTAMAS